MIYINQEFRRIAVRMRGVERLQRRYTRGGRQERELARLKTRRRVSAGGRRGRREKSRLTRAGARSIGSMANHAGHASYTMLRIPGIVRRCQVIRRREGCGQSRDGRR